MNTSAAVGALLRVYGGWAIFNYLFAYVICCDMCAWIWKLAWCLVERGVALATGAAIQLRKTIFFATVVSVLLSEAATAAVSEPVVVTTQSIYVFPNTAVAAIARDFVQ